MKKLTALMLVLSLVTVILCSCSSSEPSSQTAPSVQASKALSEVFADIKAQVQLSEMNEFTNAASLDRYYGIAEADIQEFAGGINNSGVEQEEIVLVKAADSGKVAVDYAMVRDVKKPSGSLPGKVIYTNYRTIVVKA